LLNPPVQFADLLDSHSLEFGGVVILLVLERRLGMAEITVTVKLFAAYQEAYGVPELRLQVPEGTTVEGVRDRLIEQHPELEQWRNLTRFGINLEFVEPKRTVQEGDEVVFIPPVSGG